MIQASEKIANDYGIREAKLNKVWARKGSIKIIDVPRDYFQVLCISMKDYNHALMEGPCMDGG